MKFRCSRISPWSWLLCLFLLKLGVALHPAKYKLPSFTLHLSVEKSENALIIFQDRLDTAVRLHLDNFFRNKFMEPSSEQKHDIQIELASSHVWRDIPLDNNQADKYELRGSYECHLEIKSNITNAVEVPASESIMELYLIESLQGDSYWNLVHTFLADIVLQDITDVKITILADGYMHNDGQYPTAGSLNDSVRRWTSTTIVGVIFATLFCIILILMWVYLCVFARGLLFSKPRKVYSKYSDTSGSETDEVCSTSSVSPEEDDDEEWMNAWAEAVTSIYLREPVKQRRSRKRALIRHPAQHHNSQLNSILEADDECSTVASIDSNFSHSSGRDTRRSMKQSGLSILSKIFEQRETGEEKTKTKNIPEDQSIIGDI